MKLTDSESNDQLPFFAFATGPSGDFSLQKASSNREWMEKTDHSFAKRCLPLLLANQAGWHLVTEHEIELWWTGRNTKRDLKVTCRNSAAIAESHFGYGILTWRIPFLFRTPSGINLLVRGPANYPKEGIFPLEGIVETDWSPMTFTMNWKVTRRFKRIIFRKGEPICLLVPQPRGMLERFLPSIEALEADPKTEAGYHSWSQSRSVFNTMLGDERPKGPDAWQKDYFLGREHPDGSCAPAHQTKLSLKDFVDQRRITPSDDRLRTQQEK